MTAKKKAAKHKLVIRFLTVAANVQQFQQEFRSMARDAGLSTDETRNLDYAIGSADDSLFSVITSVIEMLAGNN